MIISQEQNLKQEGCLYHWCVNPTFEENAQGLKQFCNLHVTYQRLRESTENLQTALSWFRPTSKKSLQGRQTEFSGLRVEALRTLPCNLVKKCACLRVVCATRDKSRCLPLFLIQTWICALFILFPGSDDLITLLIKILAYFNLPVTVLFSPWGRGSSTLENSVCPKGSSAVFLPVLQIISSCLA